jgi:hypothetical protein
MNKEKTRAMVIDLLDVQEGLDPRGYAWMLELCIEYGWLDIRNSVECVNARYYLGEDVAEELRNVVV